MKLWSILSTIRSKSHHTDGQNSASTGHQVTSLSEQRQSVTELDGGVLKTRSERSVSSGASGPFVGSPSTRVSISFMYTEYTLPSALDIVRRLTSPASPTVAPIALVPSGRRGFLESGGMEPSRREQTPPQERKQTLDYYDDDAARKT